MESSPHNWYLYIIRCADNSLYTGITIDLERRFQEHSAQGPLTAKYLRGRAPLKLVYSTFVGNKSDASKEEYRIKQLSKKAKEALIRIGA